MSQYAFNPTARDFVPAIYLPLAPLEDLFGELQFATNPPAVRIEGTHSTTGRLEDAPSSFENTPVTNAKALSTTGFENTPAGNVEAAGAAAPCPEAPPAARLWESTSTASYYLDAEMGPNGNVKYLTCWFWKNRSHCSKSDEECLYSHFDTGMYAERPQRIMIGGPAYAGRNAQKMAEEMSPFGRRHTHGGFNGVNNNVHGSSNGAPQGGLNMAGQPAQGRFLRYAPGQGMIPIMEGPGYHHPAPPPYTSSARRLTVGAGRYDAGRLVSQASVDRYCAAAGHLDEGLCTLMREITSIKAQMDKLVTKPGKGEVIKETLEIVDKALFEGSQSRWRAQTILKNDKAFFTGIFARDGHNDA